MADYKEKIKKLLALSKSPNEHEAQSALAKAQQLMAEHKISMAEVEDKEKKERQMNIQLELLIRLEEIPGC